jgi:hypothetical protein
MLSTLLGFLATLLASLAKAWIGEQTANSNAISLGEQKQALSTETQANVIIQQANNSRDSFKPYTADSLSNIKPGTDANFRD